MKRVRFLLAVVVSGGVLSAVLLWRVIYAPNTSFSGESRLLFVRTGTELSELSDTLRSGRYISDASAFEWACRIKRFKTPRPGRYRIKAGMSNQAIINMLRSGAQEPLLVPVQNMRTFTELAGLLGHLLEPDSLSFLNYFSDPAAASLFGFTSENFRAMFLADSYLVNWNTTPESFASRMRREYERFWTGQRKAAAAQLGLSEQQVVVLASIVKGETARNEEASKIAGLYLNRLNRGMKLQSDPTVEFAKGAEDARLTYADLEIDSPYNTYRYEGLPPGPVFFTEALYVDAVLNYEKHDYLYMCARADGSRFHQFARTGEEHARNASAYHNYLNKLGVR